MLAANKILINFNDLNLWYKKLLALSFLTNSPQLKLANFGFPIDNFANQN